MAVEPAPSDDRARRARPAAFWVKSAIPKGEVLKGTAETVFKADNWQLRSRKGMTLYPYIVWELRIEVIGPTRFKVTFPLEVVNRDLARSGATTARQKV